MASISYRNKNSLTGPGATSNNGDSPTTANYYESLLSIQSASFKKGGSGDLESMLAMSVKDLILLLAPNGIRLNAEIQQKEKHE